MLTLLPTEVFVCVLSFLDNPDILALSRTCHHLKRICLSDLIWQAKFVRFLQNQWSSPPILDAEEVTNFSLFQPSQAREFAENLTGYRDLMEDMALQGMKKKWRIFGRWFAQHHNRCRCKGGFTFRSFPNAVILPRQWLSLQKTFDYDTVRILGLGFEYSCEGGNWVVVGENHKNEDSIVLVNVTLTPLFHGEYRIKLAFQSVGRGARYELKEASVEYPRRVLGSINPLAKPSEESLIERHLEQMNLKGKTLRWKKVTLIMLDPAIVSVRIVAEECNLTEALPGNEVSQHLHSSAGGDLTTYCRSINRPPAGQHATTPGFGLRCDTLFHVSPPQAYSEVSIKHAFWNCLQGARGLGLRSILFTPLGIHQPGSSLETAIFEGLQSIMRYEGLGDFDHVYFDCDLQNSLQSTTAWKLATAAFLDLWLSG